MRLTDECLDQEKKDQMLQAAKQLFSRFGFRKTTVDEIAELASVSKRTVYENFESKEKILAELVMCEALSFRRELMAEIKKLDDPVAKFELFCELCTQYFDKNPFLGQVLFDEADLYQPFLHDEIQVIERGMQDIIANLLREGARKGVYRDMDIAAEAECVFVLFRGFTYRRAPEKGVNKSWVSFVLRAIRT